MGFRNGLMLAFALLTVGYGMLGVFSTLAPVLVGLFVIVVGGAFVKPVITGTVSKSSDSVNRARAFSIFYMVVNIGSFTGKTVVAPMRIQMGVETVPFFSAGASLLALIIADPTNWPSELTRRATTRFVYLEQQAAEIYAEREPDPALRESSHTTVMGMTAFSLQSATYNYPDFAFATSTAPENWAWRNIIPYEAAIDLTGSDLIFTWQPTWSLSSKDLLSVRASLGFTGGIVESGDETFERENYGALGLGY